MNKSRSRARAVALGGMFSALCVVIMSLGSIIPSLDMSSALIAGIVVIVARLEISRSAPVSVYLVSGILSIILLPNRFAGISFMCFYGIYPILKEYMERIKPKPLKIVVKLAVSFLLCMVMIKISEYFTIGDDELIKFSEPMLYALGVAMSIGYDFFLTIVVTRYDVLVSHFKNRRRESKK